MVRTQANIFTASYMMARALVVAGAISFFTVFLMMLLLISYSLGVRIEGGDGRRKFASRTAG